MKVDKKQIKKDLIFFKKRIVPSLVREKTEALIRLLEGPDVVVKKVVELCRAELALREKTHVDWLRTRKRRPHEEKE